MKIYTLLLFVTTLSVANAQDTPISAFLEKWENSKNYLVEIAELMPEDKYDYKPTERQKTFREQLLHIKQNMDWLSSTYFSTEKKKTKEKTPKTKADIIAALKTSFEQTATIVKTAKERDLKEIVEFFAGPKTKLQILNLLQDHVTHHRGQLIVYLNLNDIKPPRYRGW
ncbi:putative damage-inducible protein DinB [Kordia periserrulae]|uniref:Putative damage-inducible protein DinB n=1 Tax=Kordia periserrulae TaxID=701523 RepID=A0A2T6C7A5_9FLAO|nr:DinB family protein [Kordia periserrulae]PTX64200.1 putative damage-inducible protein DinB [Kordia periserrulae]